MQQKYVGQIQIYFTLFRISTKKIDNKIKLTWKGYVEYTIINMKYIHLHNTSTFVFFKLNFCYGKYYCDIYIAH